jgi:DNA repair protein RadC
MPKKTNIEKLVTQQTLTAKKNITDISALDGGKIESSKQADYILKQIMEPYMTTQEVFVALLMNRTNIVTGYAVISIGGQHSTIVDPKIVFRHALLSNSCGIIVAHNHPSGNLAPSMEDKKITIKLREVGRQLELPIFDHIIVCENDYFSFADEGLLDG